MDKRLLIVLPICLAIMVGWGLLFPQKRPAKGVTPPPVSSALTGAIPDTGQAPAHGSDPSSSDTSKALETKAMLGPRVADSEERTLVLVAGKPGAPGYFQATFTNRGGGLKELRTGNYFDRAQLDPNEQKDQQHWTRLMGSLQAEAGVSMALATKESSADLADKPLESELWKMTTLAGNEDPRGVEFQLSPGTGVTFTKRLLFVPGKDQLHFELEIKNDAYPGEPSLKTFLLTPVAWAPAESGDRFYVEPQAIAVSRPRADQAAQVAVVVKDDRGPAITGAFNPVSVPLSFAGVYSKYFAVLFSTSDAESRPTLVGASWRRLRDATYVRDNPAEAERPWRQVVADLLLELRLPAAGGTAIWRYDLYAGPKERTSLEAANPEFSALCDHDLGWVNFISSPLLLVLNFFEWVSGNWGVAIILLTISVRGLLFPINRRSQTAMARYQSKMKRLQPRIDEIKKKYEKDASRQRQEQAKLMQEEGAFPPLGGCLPMFLQFPVFIGLYRALGVSFDLRQASFMGWIHDLSLPDRLLEINLNTHLPYLGTIQYLNILPPVMVALWIWQQKGMPMPADEQAARMQKMMMWMPVMMGFFLYNYAAGLSLYMITQSGLGVLEQKVIKKYWPVDDTEQPKKKSGFMARLMAAQQEQMKRMPGQPKRRPAR